MKKLTLLKNAVILTVTSFILRTFGMVVRLYVSNKIGAEGMGLYQLIISIYVLASTFVKLIILKYSHISLIAFV